MEGLISVIIPVYKTEQYLNKCIDSVLSQTYSNLEVILVDDGSPDRCPQMCDAWAEKDRRIRVIHKENGGLSDARNAGLSVAQGEYIAFVDSDDWLETEFVEYLHDAVVECGCDVAGCKFQVTDGQSNLQAQGDGHIIRCVDRMIAVRELIDDRIRQVVWNKLYRRNLISDIAFAKGKCHEDDFWSYQVLGRVTKYAEIDYIGYNYFQHPQSIMGESYSLKRLDVLEARIDRQAYLQKALPELADKGQINLFFTCVYHGQLALMYLRRRERNIAFARLRKTSKEWRLSSEQKKMLKFTHRIWAGIAEMSLITVCRIRNTLKIGL